MVVQIYFEICSNQESRYAGDGEDVKDYALAQLADHVSTPWLCRFESQAFADAISHQTIKGTVIGGVADPGTLLNWTLATILNHSLPIH